MNIDESLSGLVEVFPSGQCLPLLSEPEIAPGLQKSWLVLHSLSKLSSGTE